MALYSLALIAVLVAGAPYWLARMAASGRYRAGLAGRLGRVPAQLRTAAAGRQVVWLHAVSVGEVLAATRLVAELEARLSSAPGFGAKGVERVREDWSIVVSTTTATGQALARGRFGAERVFYYPLDLGWAVRAYLRALRPRMLVLMEHDLWPRMLAECSRTGIPVAVVNARVGDRSFARAMRVRPLWSRLLRRVTLFLAQSEEDTRRLVAMGAGPKAVRTAGNLKYDVRAPKQSAIAGRIDELHGTSRILVAGSTLEGEEQMLLEAWPHILRSTPDAILVIAPRHPERFAAVLQLIDRSGQTAVPCSRLKETHGGFSGGTILLLDTIGDLASVYRLASAAFVGGSLVPRGGHNPLEPAQFSVPVVMGPSHENFREIVARMQAADGIRIVNDQSELSEALSRLFEYPDEARAIGGRGRQVYERQQGATARTVEALIELLRTGAAQ